ncbi:liprin-beta-1-like isoform X2 [Tubulanus polymorphus]|uniref:liprin-beta-1-like isoform X2 n=1 Tax=Tubulanus polymorphus TaxID=672921 RepID=UPI003DA380D9
MANPQLEASDMLAAALEQMDGLLAGTPTVVTNGNVQNTERQSVPVTIQASRITSLLNEIEHVISSASDKDELLSRLPNDSVVSLRQIAIDTTGQLPNIDSANGLSPSSTTTNEFSSSESEHDALHADSDRDNLVLQVSVLREQVEAQREKIRELETDIDSSADKLTNTESMLQDELLSRTSLETHKLDLMAEISNLKIRLTSSERDRQDNEEKLTQSQQQINDLTSRLNERESEIMDLKIELAKTGSMPAINAAQDIEVEKLKKAVESLMGANREKDNKIHDLTITLKRFQRLEDLIRSKKGMEFLQALDESSDPHSDSSTSPIMTPNYAGKGHHTPVANGNGNEIRRELLLTTPTATSTPGTEARTFQFGNGNGMQQQQQQQSPPSTIASSPTPHKSSSSGPSHAGSAEDINPYQQPKTPPEKKKRTAENPATYANTQEASTTMPRRKRPGTASSFVRCHISSDGYPPCRVCNNHQQLSGEAENEEENQEMQRLKDERAQQYKAIQNLNDAHKKKKGLKKLFGGSKSKLKRSNSQEMVDPGANGNGALNSEFKRGGVRSTTGPRLGWSCDLKDDLNMPFARWDGDRVAAWLHEMGLSMYVGNCKQWVKNGEQLLKASPHDLEKELGIKHHLHRKKVQLALQAIGSGHIEKFGELDHHWVTRWLDDIGLPQYKDQFIDAKVDGRMLHYMTVDDLLFMKVTSTLHHLSIKRGIQVLRLHNFNPTCLKRRAAPEEGMLLNCPNEVMTWSNHRVMEWLRTIDLSEYAPNLRGSGVHGALMVLEEAFGAELLAALLSIPSNKTLLRRHLKTHFVSLVGNDTQQLKRELEASPGYMPLTPNMKIKFKKFGLFSKRIRADGSDYDGYICPMDIQGAANRGGIPNGKAHYEEDTGMDSSMKKVQKDREEKTAKEIGAFSQEINTLTDMLAREQFLDDENIPSSNV